MIISTYNSCYCFHLLALSLYCLSSIVLSFPISRLLHTLLSKADCLFSHTVNHHIHKISPHFSSPAIAFWGEILAYGNYFLQNFTTNPALFLSRMRYFFTIALIFDSDRVVDNEESSLIGKFWWKLKSNLQGQTK